MQLWTNIYNIAFNYQLQNNNPFYYVKDQANNALEEFDNNFNKSEKNI